MSRIGEPIKYAYNPLPELSDEDVLKAAGLQNMYRPSRISPTTLRWKVDSGHNVMHFEILPGDYIELRGNEVEIFLKNHKDWGGVIVDDIDDAHEVRLKTLQGLQEARRSWDAVGTDRVTDYQINHGLNDQQIEQRKGMLWRYYYNQAIADAIDEHIVALPPVSEADPDKD